MVHLLLQLCGYQSAHAAVNVIAHDDFYGLPFWFLRQIHHVVVAMNGRTLVLNGWASCLRHLPSKFNRSSSWSKALHAHPETIFQLRHQYALAADARYYRYPELAECWLESHFSSPKIAKYLCETQSLI